MSKFYDLGKYRKKQQELTMAALKKAEELKQKEKIDRLMNDPSNAEKLAYLQANFMDWTAEYQIENMLDDQNVMSQVEQFQMDKLGESQLQIDTVSVSMT
jgi:hypothetical protein